MKNKKQSYSIVYDGADSYITPGAHYNRQAQLDEEEMSLTKAKKKLYEFFTDQIDGYRATVTYYCQARAKLIKRKGV